MKVVVINGSPKGRKGNTNVIAGAFLRGAEEAGAETRNIFLAEKEIQHCGGCHTCWSRGPGQCVINDDMLEVLSPLGWANIIVFATPVYFANISGMLKVFMDRMTMIGGPQSQNPKTEENEESNPNSPRLMMIASCGLPYRDEFQVISLWIKKVAEKMHMELIGEIYASRGKWLASPPEDQEAAVNKYLLLSEKAGKEIASAMRLSETTRQKLMEDPYS